MAEETNKNDELRDALLLKRKNGYDRITSGDSVAFDDYAKGYRRFLDAGKTEREAARAAEALAIAAGYKEYRRGMKLAPGDKVYKLNRGRAFMAAHIGHKPLTEGALISASHIDAPRIDLKPCPLYEDADMAFFKTHYYGGIRKYQWVTIPLELRGIVVLSDGSSVEVCVGEDPEDPVLVITDLLPHLAKDQAQKTLAAAFTGESLNVLVGGTPYSDDGSDRFKLAIMSILNEKYGITEADFMSAELSLVPAGKSRDVGLDKSFVGAYGQDDRVCAYTTLTALLDEPGTPERTVVCILADKEEIGSEGVSGMQSNWFDTFFKDICDGFGVELAQCYENSSCLSADVGAAYDPNFGDVYEKRNSGVVNGGALITKYTGAGGKGGASDASAELVGRIRNAFDGEGVIWQIGELGKVDQGGGGTVAKFMAKRDIDTIDIGVPVLSMHAPFEVTAKLDIYMMYMAAKAFNKM